MRPWFELLFLGRGSIGVGHLFRRLQFGNLPLKRGDGRCHGFELCIVRCDPVIVIVNANCLSPMRSREALDCPRRSGWLVDLMAGREMDKRTRGPCRRGKEQDGRNGEFAHLVPYAVP